jgi:NADPH2:quinone reductase
VRAVQVQTLTGPRDLVVADVAVPAPKPGEIGIEVHAAGVNFPDALLAQGKYQEKPPLPFTLGVEVAGVVSALGEGVTDFAVGDRVAALPSSGGYAEFTTATAARTVPLPDDVDFVTAAGMLMTYGTAYHGLVDRGRLRVGDRLAVTGAGGGVGTAAVDIGQALGAKVLGIVGSEAKADAATAAGAAHVLVDGQDLADRIKTTTGALDVLFDNVGGDVFDAALRTLDWNARVLIVGFTSGRIPAIPANRLLLRESEAVGVYWGPWSAREPLQNRANFAAMFALRRAGTLRPRVQERYALADAGLAVEALMDRKLIGKAVVVVRD